MKKSSGMIAAAAVISILGAIYTFLLTATTNAGSSPLSLQATASTIQKSVQVHNFSDTPMATSRRRTLLGQKRAFLLPEFNKIDLSDSLRRSENLIQATVRQTSQAFSAKIFDLIDSYNITQTFHRKDPRNHTLKVGILTALSLKDETMWLDKDSKYSLRKTGFAQLAKLVMAETLERTNLVNIEVHVIFDTTDYIEILHEANRTRYPSRVTYSLSVEQRKGCRAIQFDKQCRCFPPNANTSSELRAVQNACDIHNCTQIPLEVDKRWTKVASMMYWSSFFDVLIVTDDDAWPGAFIAPIQKGLNYAAASRNSRNDNTSTFLWLPMDYGRLHQIFEFSNYAFMVDVRSEVTGRNFLRKWWESRLTPVTYGDQGGMFRAILPYFRNEVLKNHPHVRECFQKLDLCNIHNLLSTCVQKGEYNPHHHIQNRRDTHNWTVSFTADLNFSRNENMGFFGDNPTTNHSREHLASYLWWQRTFLHLRPTQSLLTTAANQDTASKFTNGTQPWAVTTFADIAFYSFDQFIDIMRSSAAT